jgi:hypothetical protein
MFLKELGEHAHREEFLHGVTSYARRRIGVSSESDKAQRVVLRVWLIVTQ